MANTGCGLLAEDCAADHWARQLGGRREPTGQWRADCPICGAARAFEWDTPGSSVRWRSFCEHDKETLRPVLAERLSGCLPRRGKAGPIARDDLIALVLDDMPPITMRLRLLELTGMSTPEALDKLGVRRENRSRVISGRTGAASKRMQNRKTGPHPNG